MSWPTFGGVYRIWLSESHYYLGRSSCLRTRWECHLRQLKRGTHINEYMQNVFRLTSHFLPEVLVQLDTEGDRQSEEQRLLTLHVGQPGCLNLSVDARGPMGGRKHSEETKAKMRRTRATPEYRKRLSDSRRGIPRSPEAIAKAAASNRGKKRPLEAIQRAAESNRGRHPSEETRQRLSESHLGKPSGMQGKKHSEETKAKISRSLLARSKEPS